MGSFQQPFFFLILFSVIHRATCVNTCPISCGGFGPGPVIRFPFRLDDQPFNCGYPDFELSCNDSQAMLYLPNLGNFTVQHINYVSQTIWINDPNYCLPKRFVHDFTLSGTPFELENLMEFTFCNCSSEKIPNVSGLREVSCMSGDNFTVVAIPSYWFNESGPSSTAPCSVISTVVVPVFWPSWSGLERGVPLRWDIPDCRSCEERGGSCGFKDDKSPVLSLGCADLRSSGPTLYVQKKYPGLPRSAKYGIIIGVAIPGLLCFIGIACYLCRRARDYCHRSRYSDTELMISTITSQPPVIVMGLDGRTIESYPKTLLGESRRLPKSNDNTCPICLCEYQSKETLRTIPECNHYFHVGCIDEWLRLNATCPVCRNSPEGSAIGTASTSTSSSSLLSP